MTQVASSTMKADPTAATRALLALAQQQWVEDQAKADARRRAALGKARDRAEVLEAGAAYLRLFAGERGR